MCLWGWRLCLQEVNWLLSFGRQETWNQMLTREAVMFYWKWYRCYQLLSTLQCAVSISLLNGGNQLCISWFFESSLGWFDQLKLSSNVKYTVMLANFFCWKFHCKFVWLGRCGDMVYLPNVLLVLYSCKDALDLNTWYWIYIYKY